MSLAASVGLNLSEGNQPQPMAIPAFVNRRLCQPQALSTADFVNRHSSTATRQPMSTTLATVLKSTITNQSKLERRLRHPSILVSTTVTYVHYTYVPWVGTSSGLQKTKRQKSLAVGQVLSLVNFVTNHCQLSLSAVHHNIAAGLESFPFLFTEKYPTKFVQSFSYTPDFIAHIYTLYVIKPNCFSVPIIESCIISVSEFKLADIVDGS